jgi:hypothetical protein
MKNYIGIISIAFTIIISFWILGNDYKYKSKATENISVTGFAEKDFISDQIVWTGNCKFRAC